jgi:hypothetical protein
MRWPPPAGRSSASPARSTADRPAAIAAAMAINVKVDAWRAAGCPRRKAASPEVESDGKLIRGSVRELIALYRQPPAERAGRSRGRRPRPRGRRGVRLRLRDAEAQDPAQLRRRARLHCEVAGAAAGAQVTRRSCSSG